MEYILNTKRPLNKHSNPTVNNHGPGDVHRMYKQMVNNLSEQKPFTKKNIITTSSSSSYGMPTCHMPKARMARDTADITREH